MIKIYDSKCQDFNNNGLGILVDFKTSPKIVESLNGSFELEFDYAIKGKNVEYLIVDNILKAPYDNSEQLFRIKRVKPSLKKINVYAVHIFYDLAEDFLLNVAPENKDAITATQWLLENGINGNGNKFSVLGETGKINSARYVRKNIVEAILGADNCIVSKWNTEIERNNFDIIFHNKRGEDRGVYIKEGKNIKEIEISVDFTTVVTRIIPQGANELLLPETFIDSDLINTYRNPITKKYEFSEITVDENTSEEEAFEKLREAAKEQFANGVDKPSINVKVNWLELSMIDVYREKYHNLEFVKLGDTVTVQALGYEYKIRVIKVEYDCLLQRYISFEIGNPSNDFVTNQATNIQNAIVQNTPGILSRATQLATELINNGFGGHVRIYPDRILIMDTQDETTAQNVWQWNLNGFAHSSNGINGDYQLGITIDGRIVADMITTGTLSANRVEGYEALQQKVSSIDSTVKDNFTVLTQSINDFIYAVQHSGGNNLIKNSVMFAYSADLSPDEWVVEGEGSLVIGSSPESMNAGGLSGHVFSLSNKTVRQRIYVKSNDNNTKYTFTTKIKKDVTGSCYVKIYNSVEEHLIELKAGDSSFYDEYEINGLLPKDNYYDIEFYGSEDSGATFTDNMFALGEYKSQWTQASGEIMNTQVNINEKGVHVKSSIYAGDYTVMSPLEFSGYSNINGIITKVFSLNKDTTFVKKLLSEDEIRMDPIKIVPITKGANQGWAFTKSN